MTPQEYVTQNYDNLVKGSRNITKEYQFAEDLLSEAILIFLQNPSAQQLTDSGRGRYFIGKTMKVLWETDRSPFHKTYRRSKPLTEWWFEMQNIVPNSVDEEQDAEDFEIRRSKEKKQDAFVRKLYEWLDHPDNWYYRKLYQMRFVEGNSVSQIARESFVPRSTLSRELNKLRRQIEEIWMNIEKK